MAEFGLVKSFHIDHGELDGLSPQEYFVLGYELGQLDEELKGRAQIDRLVHAKNRTRIEESCKDAGRACLLIWARDDVAESWMRLRVVGELPKLTTIYEIGNL